MADNLVSAGAAAVKRLRDQGDGTHAEVVSVRGEPMTITATVVTIAASGTAALVAVNANRKYLFIQNIDTGNATIAPSATPPTFGTGKPMQAAPVAGGSGEQMCWETGGIPTQAFSASCGTTGTRIAVWEGN